MIVGEKIEIRKESSVKLEVPYYSQFVEISDPEWQSRACGMACLKMVLDFYGAPTSSLHGMVVKGKEEGGYTPSGWLHDYSLKVAEHYGFAGERREKMEVGPSLAEFKDRLAKGEPIIVSVFKNFSEKDKFHQVVLIGFEEKEGALTGFYCHDPDSPDKESRKGIFVELPLFTEN
ncbi:C39 family peptidase, partial [Candidatus Parcubacteria bacterium]|nr:C39 family peptidase [Candidatus Parcubacteria bacterium]